MKARYYFLAMMAVTATACLQDPEAPNNQPEKPTISVDETSVTRVSMLVNGKFGSDMTDITAYGVEVSETLFENGGDVQTYKEDVITNTPEGYTLGITGLKSNSTYYLRSYISNGQSKMYSSTFTQKTPETSVASVSDVRLKDGATLEATIEDDGGREIYDVGFVWGSSNDPKSIRREKRIPGELSQDGKTFTLPLSEVGAGTHYIMAYVEDDKSGTGFSRMPFQVGLSDDDEAFIQDPYFKAYLVEHHDRNQDRKISYGELKVIEFIETHTNEIASVREIESMPELSHIRLTGMEPRKGKLTEMPTKKNSKLLSLYCSNNQIASLDLSANSNLESLDCSGNALTELSVSNNVRLDYLNCSDNKLSALDLSNNSGLRNLNISGNHLPSMDLSWMIALKELDCRNNPEMDTLYLSINQEVSPLVSDYTTVKYVDAPEGQQENEIWYTTTDGNVLEINNSNAFGNINIVSNTYTEGQGIIKFDAPVQQVGEAAFRAVDRTQSATLKTMSLPENCELVGFSAFENQASLEEIHLPDGLTIIANTAFSGCRSLREIVLPENLEMIGMEAFLYCESLKEVTIPQSVKQMEDHAFGFCTGLERFQGKFADNSGRALMDGGVLLAVAPAGLTSYTIPSGITVIPQYLFQGYSNFTEIILPDGLQSIGWFTFAYCSGLRDMQIPESVTELSGHAFEGCSSLQYVSLPSGLTEIQECLFSACASLREVFIPEQVTVIGNSAFESCTQLKEITIPASVKTLAYRAFLGSGLESITMESTTPPAAGANVFDDTNDCPIYVPSESVNAYKSANGWTPYADRIQALPAQISVSKYLTFTSTGSTGITLLNQGDNAPVLYYSYDRQNWYKWDYNELTFSQGSPLYLCGDNPQGISSSEEKYSTFRYVSLNDSPYTVSGDIMALINKDEDVSVIPSDYCFFTLFMDNPALTAAPSLPATTLTKFCYELMFDHTGLTAAPALPATTMAEACYMRMFSRCASLTAAPALPATTLAKSCYERMFFECNALASAPALPATTLADYCYTEMFMNSNGITEAPELPAETLVEGCYSYMFCGCENLSYVKCLATDISALECTQSWLYYVASTGTFVKAANIQWPIGESGIPQGWASVDDGAVPGGGNEGTDEEEWN